jgi:hypothetical protein
MVGATKLQPASALRPEFEAFLFARIDEVGGDMPLSVVSALARLDIDPWLEAAELTQLPKEIAVQRLIALLAKLPGGTLSEADPQTIVARLIALLPAPAAPAIGWSRPSEEWGVPARVNFALIIAFSMLITGIVTVALHLANGPMPTPANEAAPSAPGKGRPESGAGPSSTVRRGS